MKKYYIIYILLISLFLLNSCDDFLTLYPISEVGSDDFYRNDDEVERGVIAIYAGMQDVIDNEWAFAEMRSDNTKTRAGRSEGEWRDFETLDVKINNIVTSQYWLNNYNVIFRANKVLENIGNVSDNSLRSKLEGEAKFARALCNFNLVRAFGDVPIIDKVIKYTDEEYFTRDSQNDVYKLIEADLLYATENLPVQAKTPFGRATKGAAQGILAKAYLTIKEFQKAESLLTQIIAANEYTLLENYNDVFYKERNKEILFAIEFIPNDEDNSQNFSYQWTTNGLNYPTDDLVESVDELNDLRFPTLFYWNPLAGGTAAWENGKYQPNGLSSEQGNDWIVIRYADVLLMHSEAIIGNNNSTTDINALASFNKVRNRAGLSSVTTLTKDLLLKERRIELCFENERFYDLVRFGVAETVLTAFSKTPEPGFVFKPSALLLPIPQREINLYDGLSQNPGYSN